MTSIGHPPYFRMSYIVPCLVKRYLATIATMTPGRPTPTQTLAGETMKTTNQPPKYLRYGTFLKNATDNSYTKLN